MTTEIDKPLNNSLEKVEHFLDALNEPVNPKAVRQNQGQSYLPISYIEAQLDRFFKGAWSCEVVSYQLLVDSIAVHVRLKVYLPGAGNITRDGLGAVPVQLAKGSARTEFQNITTGAIQRNLPAAKSFALSNAAQSLGEQFGRNVVRNQDQVPAVGYHKNEKINVSYED